MYLCIILFKYKVAIIVFEWMESNGNRIVLAELLDICFDHFSSCLVFPQILFNLLVRLRYFTK